MARGMMTNDKGHKFLSTGNRKANHTIDQCRSFGGECVEN
jgi:hypothetical protein